MKEICMEGYRKLAAAVVQKAVEDYTNALKRMRRNPHDIGATRIINDCERFFNDEMAIYSDLDGAAIICAVRKHVGMGG